MKQNKQLKHKRSSTDRCGAIVSGIQANATFLLALCCCVKPDQWAILQYHTMQAYMYQGTETSLILRGWQIAITVLDDVWLKCATKAW